MTIRRTLMAVLALALATTVFAGSPQKAGKWQMTMQIEAPNLPVKMPPFTMTHCVTEEDAKNPENAIPKDPQGRASQCKPSDYKFEGNKVTWTIDCPKQKMKGNGEITYSEDSFAGWMKMTAGDQEMTTKYSGKYLGACDEKK
ncbi:MAG TPA: DUF3617 family protein [Thermoanaerobaculia bacterium]|nr:DUF3617 family protein [Thermoanaerobaculia bacterium]